MLTMVFAGWRKTGGIDLEALEMLIRSGLHQLGADALSRLLGMPGPRPATVPCSCGQPAHFHDIRPKQLMTILGRVGFERAYYVCPSCQQGQIPRDSELDVAGTECSPGLRRMMAVVGSESSFQQGREQLAVLAGVEVTAKAVERHAEEVGSDMARREQENIDRAVQLELPQILGKPVPIMYIALDGTQVPMVHSELEGRAGRTAGQPARTREVKHNSLGLTRVGPARDNPHPRGR